MDVDQLNAEACKEVEQEDADLIKNVIKQSLRNLHDGEAIYKARRDSHVALMTEIRAGKFDIASARHRDMGRGR